MFWNRYKNKCKLQDEIINSLQALILTRARNSQLLEDKADELENRLSRLQSKLGVGKNNIVKLEIVGGKCEAGN